MEGFYLENADGPQCNSEELIRLYRETGDKEVLAPVFLYNIRFAKRLIDRKFFDVKKYGITYDDLISDASQTIMLAINSYDESTGNRFITFVASSLYKKFLNMIRTAKMQKRYTTDVPLTLDEVISNSGEQISLYDMIEDESFRDRESFKELLELCKSELTEQEYQAFTLNYLYGKSQTEIAPIIGAKDQVTVSRILAKAKKRIRENLH